MVAIGAIVVTLGLGPVAPAGVPIVAAGGVALAAVLLPTYGLRKRDDR